MAAINNEVNALLGKGSEFEGKLTFEGTVRIDGIFAGEIFSDNTLIVGENATVQAEIRVNTAVVYGEVIGDIYASSCVELHAPARVRGNIITPNLQADKGVVFDGNVKMHDEEDAEEPMLAEAPPVENPKSVPEVAEDLTVQPIAAIPRRDDAN